MSKKEGLKFESLIVFKCNCRCVMCSTGLQLDRSEGSADYHAIRPFEQIKKDIEKARAENAWGFAFSGGEPTLRKDLPELVSYARDLSLEHIEVQSNGRIYANECYAQKLIQAGVNSFVVSFHSYKKEINDKIMGVEGAFDQQVAGLKNLNKLGKKVKINIVITKLNYEFLEDHVKFLLDTFSVQELRFSFVLVEGYAKDDAHNVVPQMTEVSEHVCRAIDIAKDKAACFVYNMPPCIIPSHVNYINDMGSFDTLLLGPEFETSLDVAKKNDKVKSPECSKCKHGKICCGIWKNYYNLYGYKELKAINE